MKSWWRSCTGSKYKPSSLNNSQASIISHHQPPITVAYDEADDRALGKVAVDTVKLIDSTYKEDRDDLMAELSQSSTKSSSNTISEKFDVEHILQQLDDERKRKRDLVWKAYSNCITGSTKPIGYKSTDGIVSLILTLPDGGIFDFRSRTSVAKKRLIECLTRNIDASAGTVSDSSNVTQGSKLWSEKQGYDAETGSVNLIPAFNPDMTQDTCTALESLPERSKRDHDEYLSLKRAMDPTHAFTEDTFDLPDEERDILREMIEKYEARERGQFSGTAVSVL